jgi:recombinational DNA repair protein (RecF pathway)
LEKVISVYDFSEKTKHSLISSLKTFIIKQNRDVILKSFQCITKIIQEMSPNEEIYKSLVEDITKIFGNQTDQQILLGAFLLLDMLIEKSRNDFQKVFGKNHVDTIVK